MRGKKKHAETSGRADSIREADQSLPQSVRDVADTYRRAVEARTRLMQIIGEVDAAGRAPGMPADSVQRQLAAARGIVDNLGSLDTDYHRYRQALELRSDPESAEFEDALADLEAYGEDIASAADSIFEMADSLCGLRDRLIQVAKDLQPIRERIRSAHAAATAELARRSAYTQGRHAAEARMNVAGARLRTLEEGRFMPTPERGLTSAYRELEVEIGAIRDAVAALAPRRRAFARRSPNRPSMRNSARRGTQESRRPASLPGFGTPKAGRQGNPPRNRALPRQRSTTPELIVIK